MAGGEGVGWGGGDEGPGVEDAVEGWLRLEILIWMWEVGSSLDL
jgi:hypothetical protein